MSWLGQNGASRDDFYALADAYKAVYNKQELKEDDVEEGYDNSHLNADVKAKPSMDPDSNLNKSKKSVKKEENELLADLADAYAMMYEKKKDSDKCGDDTYWDKEEKKCKSKKKKSGTTVVVGRGGIYGPGYHGGGGGSNGDGDGDGGDTDSGGGDGGGGGGGE